MRSTEISAKYGIDEIELKNYIRKNARFSIKENFFGDIIIPDGFDIGSFIQPLLAEIEEKKRKQEEERILQAQTQFNAQMDRLKAKKLDGYYEYKVISLSDVGGLFNSSSGKVDIAAMTVILNELGIEGWHLVTAYSNELGKNALSGGAGGALLGVNSTVDENILIFERFVKI